MKITIKYFLCPYCGKSNFTWNGLIDHLIKKHDYPLEADKEYIINRLKQINIIIEEE